MQRDSDRARPPQRLLARAIVGYEEGVFSVQSLATLRGITCEAVEQYLADIGAHQHQPSIPRVDASDLPSVDVDLSGLGPEDWEGSAP